MCEMQAFTAVNISFVVADKYTGFL